MSDETTTTAAEVAVPNMSAVPATVSDNELAVLAGELVTRARSESTALTGDGGSLSALVQRVLQAGLDAEMTEHLGYPPP